MFDRCHHVGTDAIYELRQDGFLNVAAGDLAAGNAGLQGADQAEAEIEAVRPADDVDQVDEGQQRLEDRRVDSLPAGQAAGRRHAGEIVPHPAETWMQHTVIWQPPRRALPKPVFSTSDAVPSTPDSTAGMAYFSRSEV